MTDDTRQKPAKRFSVAYLIWNVASLDARAVTEEEVEYFRANPDQIDEVSSPLVLHRLFLWVGLVVGLCLAAVAKALAFSDALSGVHPGVAEFVVDMVFEIGVALIGAAIVTFMIGIALNQQQASAKRWRKDIRRRIAERR